jgi:hypothetical protein
MKKLPSTDDLPVQQYCGDIEFIKWPKGVKKIVGDGYTITNLGPLKPRRKKKSK